MLRSRPGAATARDLRRETTGRRCQQGQICDTPTRSTTLVGRCASSDVSLPTQMANGAFVVRPPFAPAFAIGTQPRPTRCEYLGCLRVGQADRTPPLRAGNLHRIPCAPQSLNSGDVSSACPVSPPQSD